MFSKLSATDFLYVWHWKHYGKNGKCSFLAIDLSPKCFKRPIWKKERVQDILDNWRHLWHLKMAIFFLQRRDIALQYYNIFKVWRKKAKNARYDWNTVKIVLKSWWNKLIRLQCSISKVVYWQQPNITLLFQCYMFPIIFSPWYLWLSFFYLYCVWHHLMHWCISFFISLLFFIWFFFLLFPTCMQEVCSRWL